MTRDRRFWPATARVAHESLAGHVDLPLTAGTLKRVTAPLADLCFVPPGEPEADMVKLARRDKQLHFGQAFLVLEEQYGWAFGFDPLDGFVGHLRADALGDAPEPTHRVTARAAHIYSAADFKSPDIARLSFGARLAATGEVLGEWHRLATGGWVTRKHISPLDVSPASDWVSIAESFLGAPYLWGGNASFGIDCSGLVQMSMWAAGRDCPRDSDLQEAAFAAVEAPYQRGDLVFWKGHVGILLDADTLLHANVHHMAVAREPLRVAIERIGAREFGAVTKIARPAAEV